MLLFLKIFESQEKAGVVFEDIRASEEGWGCFEDIRASEEGWGCFDKWNGRFINYLKIKQEKNFPKL